MVSRRVPDAHWLLGTKHEPWTKGLFEGVGVGDPPPEEGAGELLPPPPLDGGVGVVVGGVVTISREHEAVVPPFRPTQFHRRLVEESV